MPYCTRNGVKTYYEVSGEGYPFVLMHANPFDRRLFLYQVAHLSTHFKVINIDLRGYGYSDKPSVPVTVTDLCEDVVAVCHQEGAREAIRADRFATYMNDLNARWKAGDMTKRPRKPERR